MISLLLITPLGVRASRSVAHRAVSQHRILTDTVHNTKPRLVIPDSLRAAYKYTDAVKALKIHRDTTLGLSLLREALAIDSTYAPALYLLALHYYENDDERAVTYSEKAYCQDTTSRWYAGLYGQSLAVTGDVDRALPIYRRLLVIDKNNSDNYRILSMLYHQRKQPYSALAVLDSAEMRFGRSSHLSKMKRLLLIRTNQADRAIEEAQQSVEEAPYEVGNVVELGRMYYHAGRDSMARVTLRRAVQMDSTSIDALTAYGDYCMRHNDIEEYCSTVRLLMAQPDYPTKTKSEICQTLTLDRKFYGEYYVAVGRVLGAFVMHHPTDKRAIDLYGDHLLAGGEVEAALNFFKLHLDMEPPVMDYYMAVIDLEDYLSHPDSVDYYVQRAMQRFPDDATLHIRQANRRYIKGDLQGAVDGFKTSLAMAQNDTLRGQIWGYIGDTYHAMAQEQMRRKRLKKDYVEALKLLKVMAKEGGDQDRPKITPEQEKEIQHVMDSIVANTPKPYPLRISPKKAMKLCFESYENSLALNIENALVLNNYAYYLSVRGEQLERALMMSTKAISLAGNNATYLDTHAWVLYKLGRYAEARNVMRKALMLDTEADPTLMMHYGDILYALEEFYMAETYWQKALDNGADSDEVEQRLQLLNNKDK